MSKNTKRLFVFNDTDGLLASPKPMTLERANEFVQQFPRRFEKQGYYLTARCGRISPQSVVLRLIELDSEEGQDLLHTEASYS